MRSPKFVKLILLAAPFMSYALTLPTMPLQAYDCDTCEQLSHENLSTRWPLKTESYTNDPLHQQLSKQYSFYASEQQLKQGVIVSTFAPGAVIRIDTLTPSGAAKKELQANSLAKPRFYIKSKQAGSLKLQEAAANLATEETLGQSEFTASTEFIVQLKPELGYGQFILTTDSATSTTTPQDQLQTNDQLHANAKSHVSNPQQSPNPAQMRSQTTDNIQPKYRIQVFDKNAAAYLLIKTNRASYGYGDTLTATIDLGDKHQHYRADNIKATLIDAHGVRTPLKLTNDHSDHYTATIPLTSKRNSLGHSWSIETEASATVNGQTLRREAHTAFSYAISSAAIQAITLDPSVPSTVIASITVATGSRYAVQAIVFTTDNQGKKIPLELAQSAAWLPPGNHDILLSLSPDLLQRYSGALYLGAIELIDYGQIKQVFRYNKFIPLSEL